MIDVISFFLTPHDGVHSFREGVKASCSQGLAFIPLFSIQKAPTSLTSNEYLVYKSSRHIGLKEDKNTLNFVMCVCLFLATARRAVT